NEDHRAVKFIELIQEQPNVHLRRRGEIVADSPGDVILMPGPTLSTKGRLCIDLELVDVDTFRRELFHRTEDSRITRQSRELWLPHVRAIDPAASVSALFLDQVGAGNIGVTLKCLA